MTITTDPFNRRRARRGMTLVEMMISLALTGLILGAVMSAFGYISRSSMSIVNYTQMNSESRTGLEIFSRDARMASNVRDFSETGLTFEVPTPAGIRMVRYEYDSMAATFIRNPSDGDPRVLMDEVADLVFERYNLLQLPAQNNLETKQIQLQLRMERRVIGDLLTTDSVISARFILRNKQVSN